MSRYDEEYDLPDFLEFGIIDFFDLDEVELTVLVTGRDRKLYAFKDVTTDPVISKGWLSFDHRELGLIKNVVFPASNFAYLSYYTRERNNLK